MPTKSSPHAETPVDIMTQQPVLAPSSTFQLTWPAGEQPHIPSLPQGSTLEYPQQQQQPSTGLNQANPFFDNLVTSISMSIDPAQAPAQSPVSPGPPPVLEERLVAATKPPPRFGRAFSTPLPAQLKHLRHPSRKNLSDTVNASVILKPNAPLLPPPALPSDNTFTELALELADSVQMVIQTLIQISPPHLLDPAKEQLAGCTLQLPTPSVSALLTTMKNLNYMSANLSAFSSPGPLTPEPVEYESPIESALKSIDMDKFTGSGQEVISTEPTSVALDDFDIGEVMQSVGDVLSGMAAHAGVDLVLFHADVGMKHVNVRGDECGISYALCHVRREHPIFIGS